MSPVTRSGPAPSGRITLLTDFGGRDGYVAAMKGVIAELAPDARVEDAAHDVPHGDIRAAAWVLDAYWRRWPAGTVHLVVVDPGVGGARRAMAALADGRYFVAPDNGVLTRVLAGRSRSLAEIPARGFGGEVSATFHGRDLFAPAAARLALGFALESLGPAFDDPVLFDIAPPVRAGSSVRGVVEHVDRFGNLITNIPGAWCEAAAIVAIAGEEIGPVRRTYADAEPARTLALVGSTDRLEIAVRDGSAAAVLGVGRDAPVEVRLGSSR